MAYGTYSVVCMWYVLCCVFSVCVVCMLCCVVWCANVLCYVLHSYGEDEDEVKERQREEAGETLFECVLCHKTFKSEKQWTNHERSLSLSFLSCLLSLVSS